MSPGRGWGGVGGGAGAGGRGAAGEGPGLARSPPVLGQRGLEHPSLAAWRQGGLCSLGAQRHNLFFGSFATDLRLLCKQRGRVAKIYNKGARATQPKVVGGTKGEAGRAAGRGLAPLGTGPSAGPRVAERRGAPASGSGPPAASPGRATPRGLERMPGAAGGSSATRALGPASRSVRRRPRAPRPPKSPRSPAAGPQAVRPGRRVRACPAALPATRVCPGPGPRSPWSARGQGPGP